MIAKILLAADGETATRRVTKALTQQGLRVVRSFDLRSAVTAQHQCACPHHGTDQCTCQYVVLLAYAMSGSPVVITTHGRDAVTELQIVEDPNAPSNAASLCQVTTALRDAGLALPIAAEVDARSA